MAAAAYLIRALAWLEGAYAALGVVYYEQGIIQALRAARGTEALHPGESDIVSTLTQLGLLLTLVCILLVRQRAYGPALGRMMPFWGLLLLCLLSAAWSANPLTTLRRATTLLSCILFGAYLQQRYSLHGVITLAGRCAVALGLLSIFVFVAMPSIGRETALGYGNAMRGVFSQKNPMAECMLLGLTCYAYRVLDGGLTWRRAAAMLVLLACIALGRSATSLALAALVLFAATWLAAARAPVLRLLLGFLAAWAVLAALAALVAAPGAVLDLLGRDASLTGRGPLWREVIQVIAAQPLLGHGYAGFWSEDSSAVQYLWLFAGWHAPDSHNGYLEILLELGVAGLAAFGLLWGLVAWRAAAACRAGGLRESRWILLLMLVDVVLNLEKSPLPFANGFTLMLPGAWLALSAWRAGGAVPVCSPRVAVPA